MTDYEAGSSSWPEQLIVSPIGDAVEQRHSGSNNSRMLQERQISSIFRSRIVPEQISTVQINTLSPSYLLPTGSDTVVTSWDDSSLSSSDPQDLDFPLQHEIDAFWSADFHIRLIAMVTLHPTLVGPLGLLLANLNTLVVQQTLPL